MGFVSRKRTAAAVAALTIALALAASGCSGQASARGTVPAADAQCFRMFGQEDGWLVTPAAVIRTTDGWKNWQVVTPKDMATPSAAGGDGTIEGAFADAKTGWVSVPLADSVKVYRTQDGGASWASTGVSVKGMGGELVALDQNHVWMLVPQGMGMHHEEATLFASSDGGQTWSQVSKTPVTGGSGAEPAAMPFVGNKNGLTFRTATAGYLAGYAPIPGQPYFYGTEDGGKTWSHLDLPVPQELAEIDGPTYAPVFLTPEYGILPLTYFVPNQTSQTVMFFVTSDGGKTWMPSAPTTIGDPSVGGLAAWSCPVQGTIFVANGKTLNVSTDGGATWTAITPDRSLEGATLLQFATAKTGWVVANGSLMTTTDGGKTWK